MEYRSQETRRLARLTLALALALPLAAAELRFEVRHERLLRDHTGILTLDETGVSYQQTHASKPPGELARERWDYRDIQQLWLAPGKLVILTYQDRKWLLGIDREFEFYPAPGQSFEGAYPLLTARLDQRFIAALADSRFQPLWDLPVKLTGLLEGSEGVLKVGPDLIVYETARENHSRTWRYQDIENISSSGPFELTLTTYERAKSHYGAMKTFHFRLKQRLDERRLDLLWKRLHQNKVLPFLTSIQERTQ